MGRVAWVLALSGHSWLRVLGADEAPRLTRLPIEKLTGSTLETALRTFGAVIVSDVPGLSAVGHWALASLADCGHLTGFQGFSHKQLSDGSDRWTLAADDKEVVPWDVEQRCPGLTTGLALLQEAMGGASSHAVDALAELFDGLAPARAAGGFRPLLENGRILEHFHLYRRGPQGDGRTTEDAVPVHVDNGAFLVVSKALVFRGVGSPKQDDGDGLILLDPTTGEEFSPRLGQSELLILMGDAMRSFLGANVHVPGHGVRLGHLEEGSLRAWHGRMYVFPEDSVNEKGETAHSLFLAPLSNLQNLSSAEQAWWRGQEMQDDCDTKVATCWMFQTICLPRCSDGQLQECLLPNLAKGDCSAKSMDDQCKFRCPNATSNIPAGSSFCDTEVATDMYMQGFTSVFSKEARTRGCVVLFFDGANLNTPLRFALGCVSVACMGIITQALLALKQIALRNTTTNSKRLVATMMYGVNVVLGWFMMLVAMTFSIELFASATLGLMIGHFLFADTSSPVVLGTPCCAATEGASAGVAGAPDGGRNAAAESAAPARQPQCCMNDANGQANVPLLAVVAKPHGAWDKGNGAVVGARGAPNDTTSLSPASCCGAKSPDRER